MESYRNKQKDLQMVFIDLEKAYDRILYETLWEYMEKRDMAMVIFDLSRISIRELRQVLGPQQER